MQEVLNFDANQPATHAGFNALDLALEAEPEAEAKQARPLQLRIANAVWAEQTQTFRPELLDTLAVNYGAGVQLSDFINNYEAVRAQVNDWVEDQTEDKIKDLVPPGAFTQDTRMALVNAIYFKADWLHQFSSDNTQEAAFHLLDGKPVRVPMMHQQLMARYASGDGWQMVELPYAGETASMLILLPDQGRFAQVEAGMGNESLSGMLSDLQTMDMLLSMPKFKFESSFSLADQLADMGMPDAFDRGRADFSGMTGKQDLFISDVIHKAFVAVDEEGTEAAAATVVVMVGTAAMITPLTLKIDRPFIFAIRDNATGQLLFIGRVVDPS
jgi:serpin B